MPRKPNASGSAQLPQSYDPKEKTLGNFFEHLEVEDPVAWTYDPAKMPQSPKLKLNPVIFDLEAAEEEASFAICCLLREMHSVSTFVQSTWKQYELDHINLVSATLTTKVAMTLMQRADEHFRSSFQQFTSYKEIMEYLNGSPISDTPVSGINTKQGRLKRSLATLNGPAGRGFRFHSPKASNVWRYLRRVAKRRRCQ